jgi:hypothetical protein
MLLILYLTMLTFVGSIFASFENVHLGPELPCHVKQDDTKSSRDPVQEAAYPMARTLLVAPIEQHALKRV